MRPWLSASLFWRFFGVELIALTMVWLILVAVSFGEVYAVEGGPADHDLQLITRSIARLSESQITPEHARQVAEDVRALNLEASEPKVAPDQFAYQVWTSDGRLLARSEETPRLPDLPPGSIAVGSSERRPGWLLTADWGPNRRAYAVVGQSERYYALVKRVVLRQLVQPYFVAAAFMGIALSIALRIGFRPLRSLAKHIATRSARDLTPIPMGKRYRELSPLVDGLNGQLARIDRMIASEREFFADAAHELRTPLAVIGAQAHVLAHEKDEDSRLQALQALERGVRRAADVVQRLLFLARLDAADAPANLVEFNVVALLEELAGDHAARAAARGQSLIVTASEPLLCKADEEAIETAVENLLDNALKYTPPGTVIRITASLGGDQLHIEVSDDGPGIAPQHRERVFERFERLGMTDESGSGLGLAIVRRIAELHRGRVTLDSTGKGSRFVLSIPADGTSG